MRVIVATILCLVLTLAPTMPSWANPAKAASGSDPHEASAAIVLSREQVSALRACFDGVSSAQVTEPIQVKVKVACYEQTLLPLLISFDTHSAVSGSSADLVASAAKSAPPHGNKVQTKSAASVASALTAAPEIGQKYLRSTTKQVTQRTRLTLVKAKKDVHQRWMYYFDNGQVWQQQEARYMSKIKQFPVQAIIEEGILGSHNLTFDNSRKVYKVRRVQ